MTLLSFAGFKVKMRPRLFRLVRKRQNSNKICLTLMTPFAPRRSANRVPSPTAAEAGSDRAWTIRVGSGPTFYISMASDRRKKQENSPAPWSKTFGRTTYGNSFPSCRDFRWRAGVQPV